MNTPEMTRWISRQIHGTQLPANPAAAQRAFLAIRDAAITSIILDVGIERKLNIICDRKRWVLDEDALSSLIDDERKRGIPQ